MHLLLKEIRSNPILWLLAFVPVVFIAQKLWPEAHTMLFVISILAIVPLATLLSSATESVATKTGDAVGGLLNATLSNLTELIIALAALSAGQYTLVKASIAGAIVDAGASPSTFTQQLSLSLSVLLIGTYALGLFFSLWTHRELFAGAPHHEAGEETWSTGLALAVLAGVTVLVALTSEVFVESMQEAAKTFGMTPAFVGFIVVALVGGAAEMASAFSGPRKDRPDLSVGIALGSAAQIALFVAPMLVLLSYVIGPTPMDLRFWPGAVIMVFIATMTAFLMTSAGRSAWFVGVFMLMVYTVFAMTLYLLPPTTP